MIWPRKCLPNIIKIPAERACFGLNRFPGEIQRSPGKYLTIKVSAPQKVLLPEKICVANNI